MAGLEDLLTAIERGIIEALRTSEAHGHSGSRVVRSTEGLVSAKMTLNVGYLDELGSGAARASLRAPEPLVDVFDEGDFYRVVILLPGIRKGDVRVLTRPRILRVEIAKNETVYYKDIACGATPSRVKVESVVENNSVIEMTFVRKKRSLPT